MKQQRFRTHPPLGNGEAAVAGKNSERWSRSALARCPRRARRCALDSAHRSPLARFALRVSAVHRPAIAGSSNGCERAVWSGFYAP